MPDSVWSAATCNVIVQLLCSLLITLPFSTYHARSALDHGRENSIQKEGMGSSDVPIHTYVVRSRFERHHQAAIQKFQVMLVQYWMSSLSYGDTFRLKPVIRKQRHQFQTAALDASLCSRCQATHCQQPYHCIKKFLLIRLRIPRWFCRSTCWISNWSHSSGMFFCIDYCVGLNLQPGLWMVTNECHWICGTNMRETPILRNQSRKFRCATRFIGWLYLPSQRCYRKGCSNVPKRSKLNKTPRVGRLLYQIQTIGCWWCRWGMNDKAKQAE